MCITCIQKNIYSNKLDAFTYPSLSLLPGSIEKMPYDDVVGFEYGSESGTGNAVFDLEWSGGEFYVGKTVSISYMIEDADGFNQDNVTVEWYHFGNDIPIHVGNSFTLSSNDLGEYISVVVKFTDNLGNVENWGDIVWSDQNSYKILGQVISTPTEVPNSVRTTVSYSDFLEHFYQAGLSGQEDVIKVLAETHQGKWGGDLGTSPSTISYSITPQGVIDYSDAQYNEHPLYADIEDAGSVSGLGASEFTSQDLTNIEIALNDWSSITGIEFVRDDTLGSKADLVFTKLDFAAWSNSSSWISPASAGFAFQPGVGSDFLVGDIFIDADLSNGPMAGMSVRSVASHEIGHALGLAHPHDGYFVLGDGNSPYVEDLPNFNSVMSYDGTEFFQSSTPMMYDFWIMQALYGTPAPKLTDDQYIVNIDDFIVQPGTSGNYYRAMLHDDGGNDSLNFVSNVITSSDDGIFVNLNKGSFSSFRNSQQVTDLATTLANGNYQISEYTEIETLTVTEGSDKIEATVDWSTTINSLDGNDEITTNGNGARIFGGDGNDTLIVNVADISSLYAEATSATSGSLRYKVNNELYCEATDIEFITLIDDLATQQFEDWDELASQLLPPPPASNYNGPSGSQTIVAPNLSGKTIYTIDADSVTEDNGDFQGVTNDGLYVFVGTDLSGGTGGWDGYRLEGNAQQGYNVVEKVDNAYSVTTKFDNQQNEGVVGDAGIIVEISGATYEVYDLTTSDGVASNGKYAVDNATWTVYAVTGDGSPENPYVLGAEDTGGSTDINSPIDLPGSGSVGSVHEFAASDGSNLDGQIVALIGDDSSGWDAYNVSGGDGSPFAKGDKIADDLFASKSEIDTASFDVEGYLQTATSVNFAGGAQNEELFEIQRVPGERYGNIVTYGVKLKDGNAGESVTFDSLTFNVKWEADASSEDYAFWGQFKPAQHAPAVGSNSSNSNGSPVTFYDTSDDGITFGMYADTGIKFDEGEYIATFMLEKTNTDSENTLYLNTAQYTLYDATDMGSIKAPETPQYGTQADESGTHFDFSYANHQVGLNLEADDGGAAGTGAGQDLADVELLVTDIAKGEGLSLVPIAKNGNIIQYQVVMNVPIPVFIQADTDNNVTIDPDYKIEISGAQIFDHSVTSLMDLAPSTSQAGDLVAGATLLIDNVAAAADQKASQSTYTGHNFYDTITQALNPFDTRSDLDDLSTSSSLTLEIKGLNLPDVPSTDAQGRYVLAEFSAISGATTAITYQSSQGDTSSSGYGSASSHTITRNSDSDGALAGASTVWNTSVADGGEVTALAEAIYTNEKAFNDAIGAEDALGALKVSRDGAMTAADNMYSQAQIIAADFNMDGAVTSADAYDILQYAVHGHESNGPTAKWVYIDKINTNEATPKNVKFDGIIDKFVGDAITIDATGVLLGDVSQSYSGPPSSSDTITDLRVSALEALSNLGIADMNLSFSANDGTATGATGRDLIYVSNSGSYEIASYESALTDGKMSGDVIAVNYGIPTLSFGGAITSGPLDYTSTAADGSEVSPTLSEIMTAADAVIDTVNNAVRIQVNDTANADPVTHYIVIDMDGNGTIAEADDLIISAGSAIHIVSNPLDVELFNGGEYSGANVA